MCGRYLSIVDASRPCHFFIVKSKKKRRTMLLVTRVCEFGSSYGRFFVRNSTCRILRFTLHNHTISRTMQEIGNIFFKNYPHRFVQPLRIPNVSITESYSLSLLPSSQRARDRIHPPFPNSSASLSTNTRKKSWPRVVEKASLYILRLIPVDGHHGCQRHGLSRSRFYIYIYTIRASLSLVALFTGSQPLYRGREGRPPRKTLIGSVHAVDSQALIIIFFDSRLSPARAARA